MGSKPALDGARRIKKTDGNVKQKDHRERASARHTQKGRDTDRKGEGVSEKSGGECREGRKQNSKGEKMQKQ